MAELAQLHADWNERLIGGVYVDELILNATVDGDKETAINHIEAYIRQKRAEISREISATRAGQKKLGALTELDLYFFNDRKPPLKEQLYSLVIHSEEYNEKIAEKAPPVQETPVPGGVVSAADRYCPMRRSLSLWITGIPARTLSAPAYRNYSNMSGRAR